MFKDENKNPEALLNAVRSMRSEKEATDYLMRQLNPKQSEALQSLLKDPSAMQSLLSSPQAAALLKLLTEDKHGEHQ